MNEAGKKNNITVGKKRMTVRYQLVRGGKNYTAIEKQRGKKGEGKLVNE